MSDTLIYAMSTIGSMKLDRFNELFRHVYFPVFLENEEHIDVDAKQKSIRALDSLGYCEFDFDKRMVYLCKPELVLLPNFGLPKAILVGARTPGLIKKIQKAVYKRRKYTVIENVIHSRENAAIPRAIYIHATDKKIIEDIANQVGISCDVTSPASWRLACLSTAINEIKAGISFVEYAEPGWKKRTFNKERLVFSNSLIEEESQRLVEYRHPFTNQLHHWLWMNNTAAEVNRDWGRYMVLSDAGYNILIYNEQEFKLAVPATIPLPCLLARAAALCSGIPPLLVVSKSQRIGNIPPNHPFQIYSRVPPKIATTIAQKLCQKFINKSFTVDKKGILYA